MVPWWMRLVFSLASAILAGAGVGAAGYCWEVLRDPASRFQWSTLFLSILLIGLMSIPGWLVAAPVVLALRHYERFGLWRIALIGLGIGPFILGASQLISYITDMQSASFAPLGSAVWTLATTVSAFATGFYLFMVRWWLRREKKGDAKSASPSDLASLRT